MSSDDYHFLDVLGGISNDIKKFSANVFDFSDRQLDAVASSIRASLDSSWLPSAIRPAPSPPPLPVHASYWDRAADWISRHRAITAALVAFAGAGGVAIYVQRQQSKRRRRAKRAPNGARTEVVLIAGPPDSPVTRSLMFDLEKRGFIVYVVVNDIEEEDIIKHESATRLDIRPFLINTADSTEAQQAMYRFKHLITSKHHAFKGKDAHGLSFAGLIIVPDLNYQAGPVETIAPDIWSDALNTKVIGTIAIAQALLPAICEFKARVLVLTPNVVASLRPAFHGVETTVVHALDGFSTTLRRELSTLGISVSQIRLGNFDFSRDGAKNHLQTISASRTHAWPLSARKLYAQNFVNQSRTAESQGVFSGGETGSIARATSPRELHYTVFDALTQSRPKRVYRVGRGSLAYDIIGAWVPGGIVGWVLGLRKVSVEDLDTSSPVPVRMSSNEDLQAQSQSWENVERENEDWAQSSS